MSDQSVQFTGEQAGQPANASPKVEPVQGIEASGLTEERIRAIVQSQTDKLEARLKAALTAEHSQQQPPAAPPAAPVQPPQVNADQVSEQPKPAQAPAGTGLQSAAQLVNEIKRDYESEYGFFIDTADPEAASIDKSSAKAFLATYRAALKAKANRTQTTPGEPTQPPQVRMPMAGGGGSGVSPVESINDPSELIRIGLGLARKT